MDVQLNRRQLLTAAGLCIGIGAVGLADTAPAAAASAVRAQLRLLGDRPRLVLSPGAGRPSSQPRLLAVEVLRDATLPAGTVVTVSFDGRLYVAADPPTVTLDGHPLPSTSQFSDAMTCAVTIGPAVPADGQLVVHVADARMRLYPNDLIADPILTAWSVAGTPTDLRPSGTNSPAPTIQPWGVEMYAAWNRKTWGAAGEFRYHYPTRISVRGTGPGRAPHPASFAVTVDPQLIDHVTIADIRHNRKPLPGGVRPAGDSRTGSGYTTRWRTSALLGAGDVLDIALRVRSRSPHGPLKTITHPVVTVWDMGTDLSQRQTGLTSSSRLDAVWQ